MAEQHADGVVGPDGDPGSRAGGTATTSPESDGEPAKPLTLRREAPWRNPEPWWLRFGVRPYLLLADVAAFGVATVITSPTSPVHVVVLLVYLVVFYVAGLYRSRLNLSLLDDLPYILAASVVGFAIKLALISLFPHVDPPGQQVVHAVALLAVVLVVRRIAYTVVRRARCRGRVRHRTLILGAGQIGTRLADTLRERGTTDWTRWDSSTPLLRRTTRHCCPRPCSAGTSSWGGSSGSRPSGT